jgi:TRAP transporter TAXI family solute receptor
MYPEVINWARFEKGDVVTEPISLVLSKELGVPVNVITLSSPKERNVSLANGQIHMCFISNTNYFDSMRGVYYESNVFDPWDTSFGPPRFRLMFAGFTMVGSPVVRVDSNINTIRDLKGKKIALANAYPSVAINGLAGLAFGGLTSNDVQLVPVGSYTDGIEKLLQGLVDAAYSSPTGRAAELAVSDPGLRWIPMPHSDNEAWERFWAIRPFLKKVVYDKGLMEGKPLEMFKAEYMLLSMDFQSEDCIYQTTKVMHENYYKFKDEVTPLGTEQVNIERTLDLQNYEDILIPYHSGFINLAKDLGLWTKQHAEYQVKALKDQEYWIASWRSKYKK